MNDGRLSICVLGAILCGIAWGYTPCALAEDKPPSVEIDSSVIMELPQTILSPGAKRMVLRPPKQDKPAPDPAAPSPFPRATLTAPVVDNAADDDGRDMDPTEKRRLDTYNSRIPFKPEREPVNAEPAEIKQFPVVTKIRSDSTDPSLPVSTPVPLPKHMNKDVASALSTGPKSESIPIVGRKGKYAVQSTGPVAKRHPGAGPDGSVMILQKNPDSDKTAVSTPVSKSKSKNYIAPVQNPKGMPDMPAVPPPAVIGTPMIAGQSEDELLSRMMEMEKKQVISGIEDVVKRTQTRATIPAGKTGKTLIRPDPIPLPSPKAPPAKTADAEPPMPTPMSKVAATKPPAVKTAPAASAMAKIAPASSEPHGKASPPLAASAGPMTVVYASSEISMNAGLQKQIDSKIVPMLKKNRALRLQIQAFASEIADDRHTSRQRSLARALAVRTYLIGLGIEPERLDMRAMGSQSDKDPLDRVDFVPLSNASKAPG